MTNWLAKISTAIKPIRIPNFMKLTKICAILAFLCGCVVTVESAPVGSSEAVTTVKKWLRQGPAPLGARMGREPASVQTFKDSSGAPLYHVVNLKPAGFVIVAAEDQVEPIIAFVEKGTYDPAETNPLGALVARDLPQRVARARHHANTAEGFKNLAKWQKLGNLPLGSTNSDVGITNNPKEIADIRIAPLLVTSWNQGTAADSNACFNFFTPPYMAGSPNNSLCGCVATALAQVMYYNRYPTAGVGTAQSQVIYTDGSGTNLLELRLRGGDGHGGPYQWNDMPLTAPPLVSINLNASATGGSTEVDTPVNLGPATSATLTIDYNMYSIPDDMRVFYGATNGTLIYDTGLIAGSGTFVLPFGPTNGIATNLITVVMDQGGGQSGTVWDYSGSVVGGNTVSSPTLLQAEAVGALTFDIGLAVHMNYSFTESTADFSDAETALLTTFQYTNAILASAASINIGYDLPDMINPNLDARKPVLLAIVNSAAGHCVVCDGYGYNFNVLYHHLNMGWSGVDDAWYQLPLISLTDTQPYYVLDGIIYNVFTNQTGEIISGRVTDTDGNALTNASVSASGGGASFQTTTDTNGIYAFPCVPSNTGYTVIAANHAYLPSTNNISVGQSSNGAAICGNVWGTDFALAAAPLPPEFILQPVEAVSVVGYSSYFSASATTLWPVTYQWQYLSPGSSSWLNVATKSTNTEASPSILTINPVLLNMNGDLFQCIATDAYGSVTSSPAILYVTTTPFVFSVQPVDAIATLGSNATFYAGTAASPPVSYQWQYQAVGSSNWFNVIDNGTNSGSQTTTVTIGQVDLSLNGEQLRCIAVNAYSSITSAPAILYVNYAPVIALSTLAGQAGIAGSTDGLTNTFSSPRGIAVDANTNIFVADMYNHVIRLVVPSAAGWTVSTIAGLAGSHGSADGAGTNALFDAPYGVALSGGNLLVADTGNSLIRQLAYTGSNWAVTTIAGKPGTRGNRDGIGTNSLFSLPMGIAADSKGNLYVADEANHDIRELTFNPSTGWTTTTIAGSGANGSNDGTNNAAQFGQPYGITLNEAGTIFVTDYQNHTIRQLQPVGTNWVVTTIAGINGMSGSTDGSASVAKFNYPADIAADSTGNLYVADFGNDIIRRLTPVGTNWSIFTVAGLAGTPGSVDGAGTAARMNGPFGIAINNTNIYISDLNNDTIRGAALPSIGGGSKVLSTNTAVNLTVNLRTVQNSLRFSWLAEPGQSYKLQYKTNLSQPAWLDLADFTPANTNGVFVIPAANGPQQFYRVLGALAQ